MFVVHYTILDIVSPRAKAGYIKCMHMVLVVCSNVWYTCTGEKQHYLWSVYYWKDIDV